MIKEALSFLYSRADEHANRKPHVRDVGPRTREVTYNGERFYEDVPAPLFEREVQTIDSLVKAVASFGGDSPTVYVSESVAVAILCDTDRRETVTMRFSSSVQAEAMNQLMRGVNQQQMIKTLRTQFAGCIEFDDFLIRMRRLEFTESAENRGEIVHGRDSLGASVDRAVVSQMGEIPEEVWVTISRFSTPHDFSTTMRFQCAVVLDTANKQVALKPIGDQYDTQCQEVLAAMTTYIRDQLTKAGVKDGEVLSGQCRIVSYL